MNLEADINLGENEVREMATIFKKTSSRPLTRYQQRINEASQKLATKNPGLLRSRKQLLAAAREWILEDGFQFAKGKSRSKNEGTPPAKRRKLNIELRESRQKEVVDTIKDYEDRILFKERRISACINISDYKSCDDLKL